MSARTPFACLVLATAMVAGCGTTQVIRQTNDIAEAGKAYTTAMDALADYVLAKEIDERYHMLVGYRRSARTDVKYFSEQLESSSKDTIKFADEITLYRKHTSLLGQYFDALNELVDANVKDTAVANTKAAAEGLNSLGKALQSSLNIADEQVTALSNLGGIVFTEIHGSKVKEVMQRDGSLIARQIAIQQKALAHFERTLKRIDNKTRDDLYLKDIHDAYTGDAAQGASRPALDDGFKAKWVRYVSEPTVASQLTAATEAADKLQKAWRAILEGKGNMSDLLADSGKILAAAEQAKALHENRGK